MAVSMASYMHMRMMVCCVQVIDMGCAECRLLRMLKREPYVEELVGVDYDGVLLRMSEHVVQPLTTDYLMPRDNPLQFTLMQGVC